MARTRYPECYSQSPYANDYHQSIGQDLRMARDSRESMPRRDDYNKYHSRDRSRSRYSCNSQSSRDRSRSPIRRRSYNKFERDESISRFSDYSYH
jgi:hypothetical protein